MYSNSASMGGRYPSISCSRSWLNHATQRAAAASSSRLVSQPMPRRWMSSVLHKPMVVPISAFAYAVPTRPTEPANPRSSSYAVNASEVHCEPASLCTMTPLASSVTLERCRSSTACNSVRRPNCRCATDRTARHGPYYEWGHMHDGKLVHRSVPAERAELMQHAIENYERVGEPLHERELLSADEIITPRPDEDWPAHPYSPHAPHIQALNVGKAASPCRRH